jgi:ubiquinone/menaquinone biosynthesis C-methylase UbiE
MNNDVQEFWEQEACGTGNAIVGERDACTKEWFEQIEQHRYRVEPYIHSIAQFTRHHGKRVLEVGVGAGSDHLQWARAGAECYGVDLTRRAIETTQARFDLYGFKTNLRQIDAEILPFPDDSFDVVYSWGVIHHAEHPEQIVREVRRVLKPSGLFIGMLYGRHSLVAVKLWVKHALLRGQPWRTLSDVIWHHMESIGTKAYTLSELQTVFTEFRSVELTPLQTIYDQSHLPVWLCGLVPGRYGWFIAVRASK